MRNEFFGPRFSDPSAGGTAQGPATDAAGAAGAAGVVGASSTLGSDDFNFNGVEWPPTFYRTHQFNLELFIHQRLLHLESHDSDAIVRVATPEEADVIWVPYYSSYAAFFALPPTGLPQGECWTCDM